MPQARHPGPAGQAAQGGGNRYLPRLIAWEVTRSCPLNCKHCRASAGPETCAGELSTAECRRLLDNIASFARPIIILTGGEPMLRPDIYDIASYAHRLGLPVVMAPCGLLVNDDTARRIVECGIRKISISLDGASAETHDAFRGFAGSFDACMDAIGSARSAGLDFQINTTVSRHNLRELGELLELAVSLGASVFNPFLLVPTGRGKDLIDQELSARQYEEALEWLAGVQGRKDIQIRVTCAPHYQRVLRQAGRAEAAGHGRGCMGGKGFAFVSHVGKVQICGFLDVECGDVRAAGFDFRKIWETSPVFLQMRDVDRYHGRCGVCEYRRVCGGCRARAYALSGDYLGEEPFCAYQPAADAGHQLGISRGGAPASPRTEATSGGGAGAPPPVIRCSAPVAQPPSAVRRILAIIQDDFPIERRPFDALSGRLGMAAGEVLAEVRGMVASGTIRRLGAVFDSRRLGYVSTLVAAKVPAERLDEAAAMVSAVPGVTHNYARRHAYNLWFTLTARSQDELEATLAQLRRGSALSEMHSLPALAIYKSRVVFSMDDQPAGDSTSAEAQPRAAVPHELPGRVAQPPSAGQVPQVAASSEAPAVRLDDLHRAMIRLLQSTMPLVEEPFDAWAGQIGVEPDALVDQARRWLAAGVIRRFGAAVAHRKLGFTANGMAVFVVPPDRLDEAGRRLAQERAISHVYVRATMPDWPYNLFAMAHGRSEQEIRQLASRLAAELLIETYDILFSTVEYKKTSVEFFADE